MKPEERIQINMKKEAFDRANEFLNQYPTFKYTILITLICGITWLIFAPI